MVGGATTPLISDGFDGSYVDAGENHRIAPGNSPLQTAVLPCPCSTTECKLLPCYSEVFWVNVLLVAISG